MYKILLSLIIALTIPADLFAQRFASSLLKQSAEILKLEGLADLPIGYSVQELQGTLISIVKHGDRIDHIGRKLFPEQLRKVDPLPIYDYLEFAWLEQSMPGFDNPYKYKEIFFKEGNWDSLKIIDDNTTCSVVINDGLHYTVTWTPVNQSPIELTFPVNYEIISSATRGELEKLLIEDLCLYQSDITDNKSFDFNTLRQGNNGLFLLEGEKYLLPTINSNLYFSKEDGLRYSIVCDTTKIRPSLSNLFCSGTINDKDWQIHILFKLHESKQDTITVSVVDFTDYLTSSGCNVFWGVEEETEEKITGTLFAYNTTGGYNHVFKVSCNKGNVKHLSCMASLYVPTTNIKNLHKQYKPKSENEKVKW